MAWVGAAAFWAKVWTAIKVIGMVTYVVNLWEAKKKANRSPTYGFDITTQCTNEIPIPIVYGKAKSGGNIIWAKTSDDQTTILILNSFGESTI